jgi:3-hydroxybutyryl-CoA dehydrogenase
MENIAVIGAGTMGNGIAHVFAQHNYKVQLIDISKSALDSAIETISRNLDRQVLKDLITKDSKDKTLNNISTFTSIQEGIIHSDLIIEAVSENEELKLKIFNEMDRLAPESAILASNTSSISIARIASTTKRPDKVIGMHFMNPVPIMKLVEVIKAHTTSEAVTHKIMELAKAIDKIPVEVNDAPGFVANRILMPMINESIETLHNGVAGVYEIDTVMKLGIAHPMGPLQLADFIGLDVCLSILNVLYHGFKNPKYAPCPLLVKMVDAGTLGIKSGIGFYDYSKTKKADKISHQFL